MAFLAANNGPNTGRQYDLSDKVCILGRHPECHIVIETIAVSRQHARIEQDGREFFLEDLNSRNGTFVNNRKIQARYRLRSGDVVRICDVSFTFRDPDAERTGEVDDSSTHAAILVDDEANSTIMSTLDVASSSHARLAASSEAKLAALLEITKNLGRALSLDEVLPQVLNSLFKIFVQADRGFIGLLNEQGTLVPRWTRVRRPNAEDTIRVSRTIARHVMESREAILSADAASDSRWELSQSIADFRIRSMMCAPLLDSEGRAVGILQIDTLDQRNRFQPEDLELLVAVANQAGIAIDNAQLHENALRQRALERDLELAHEVQRGFLPNTRPQLGEYQFFDYYEPANHIGGDYFDYIRLPDGRVAIVVADVVGHGVAAALLMAKLSAETRYCLASEMRPADAVNQLNKRLSGLHIERFVTLIMAVLDPQRHETTIVNAGHMAPILRRAHGRLEEPSNDGEGLPLGILAESEYEQTVVRLEPGDTVVLYTDGINECVNAADQAYGIERIRQRVGEATGGPVDIGEAIISDVRQFVATQEDDMCLVTFGRGKAGK